MEIGDYQRYEKHESSVDYANYEYSDGRAKCWGIARLIGGGERRRMGEEEKKEE